MGNTFTDVVRFKHTWRPSQVSLMSHVKQDLSDGRLHYVVAPGGGKKSIGLELIRRLDGPALILVPSQRACEEWKSRFQEDFLPESEPVKNWIGKDAAIPTPIILMTYQDMFSTMNIGKPFIKWLLKAQVQTLCLDEPHHLRNEWWKMLEKIKDQMPALRIVTLACAEPWDTLDTEWERYQELCGPVDERITAPELVKEGVCCPYQDYLYLCRPTKKDEEHIESLRAGGKATYERLLHDEGFLAAVKAHLSLVAPDAYDAFFRENPAYMMAFLSYLKENKVAIPAALLGKGASEDIIPAMDLARMEILLKGFLGYDKESYDGCLAYQKQLEAELKESKAILRGKLDLLCETDVKRVLNIGGEKYPAIETIVRSEMDALGEDMRMLILTEHVKKEQMPLVGELNKDMKDIGALPVFEVLRRANIEGLYMMIATNTFMVIPDYLVPWFEEHTSTKWEPLKETGYCWLQMVAEKQEEAQKWMTLMFEEGYANVLIATGAQLQENWSTRCVNSLVIATEVGHLNMASRMRGIATLADPKKPERVTNIWHVVTMDPDANMGLVEDRLRCMGGELRRMPNAWDVLQGPAFMSEDMGRVVTRFHTVTGLRRGGAGFESGIARVLPLRQDFSATGVAAFNQKELQEAKKRNEVHQQWEKALQTCEKVTEEVSFVKEHFPKTAGEKQAQRGLGLCGLGLLAIVVELLVTHLLQSLVGDAIAIGIYVVLMVMLVMQMRGNVRQLAKTKTPKDRVEGIAKGVMEALQDGEVILSPEVACRVLRDKDQIWHVSLSGATALEQETYAECLTDFLGPIGDTRYLILEKNADGTDTYYPVPELFSYSKADARLFYRNMNEYMGDVILIYTGAEMGYASLKEAQWKSYERVKEYPVHHKKVGNIAE